MLTAGSSERQRDERRNTFAMGTASLCNDVGSEMVYPLLPAFVATVLGAPPVLLGLIEGLAETTASLARLASGVASDRLRRRKPLASAGYLLANVLRPALGLATAWPHVLALRFGDRLGKGVRSAPRDALLADSVPAERRASAADTRLARLSGVRPRAASSAASTSTWISSEGEPKNTTCSVPGRLRRRLPSDSAIRWSMPRSVIPSACQDKDRIIE